MFKKYWFILLAFIPVFGLMMTGCDNGNSDNPPTAEYCQYCEEVLPHECSCPHPDCLEDYFDCKCDYWYTVLTVVQHGASLPTGIPEVTESERDSGKGYIVGTQFNKIKNAPFGSIFELTLTGITNLDWTTIGSIGHSDMALDIPDVTFAPANGTYTREVLVEDIYRIVGFGDASAINVNILGDHKIDKVLFGRIKEEDISNKTPQLKDFHIDAILTQFLEDGAIIPVTVVPHWRMSQGVITIKYSGNIAVPSTAGLYTVTFDVAAATGFIEKGFIIGTLNIIKGESLEWDWEMEDDRALNKFAPGISTLFGYVEHPTLFAQAYTLANPYVSGNPATGRHLIIEEQDAMGRVIRRVATHDARGYYANLAWPANKSAGDLIPLKVPVPKTVTGPHGNLVEVFHLSGLMLQKGSKNPDPNTWVPRTGVWPIGGPVISENDYRFGCGWPAVSLYATPPSIANQPNQETRWAFMDGYGYSFWVKSNNDYSNYRTSVENWDYRPREGHEPGHWFGTKPGRDASQYNFTPAPVGQWTLVTVIYDPSHPEYNLDVNQWIYMYSIDNSYPNDDEPTEIYRKHDKNHNIRIAFSFQLQHNGGNEGNNWIEYSIDSGRHEYDVYIYDLRILKY